MLTVDTAIDYISMGKRIRLARQKKGFTQEALATEIDISTTYMSSIENGKTKLSLGTLVLIANALDTTTDSLLYDSTTVLISQYDQDAKELLSDCSPQERTVIMETLAGVKHSLRKNYPKVHKQ